LEATLLKDYGWCKVALFESEYFLSFDEGQVVIKMNSYKISEDEANQAIKSEEDAEKNCTSNTKQKSISCN